MVIRRWLSGSDDAAKGDIGMKKRQLKPPFYRVVATCHQHGTVVVERKPHPKTGQQTECGAIQQPTPMSIVCPHCTYHARVTSTQLIEA